MPNISKEWEESWVGSKENDGGRRTGGKFVRLDRIHSGFIHERHRNKYRVNFAYAKISGEDLESLDELAAPVGGYPEPEDKPDGFCNAWRKKQGRFCKRKAKEGERFCAFHLGGKANPKKYRHENVFFHGAISKMPFYTHKLPKTLQEAIQAQVDLPAHEQFCFREELALFRNSGEKIVEMYGKAVASGNQDLILETGVLMRDYLKQVVAIGKDIAATEAIATETLTQAELNSFINFIVRQAYEMFGTDMERAREFERQLRGKVKALSHVDDPQTVQSTTQDVFEAMAYSVPIAPDVTQDTPHNNAGSVVEGYYEQR